MNGMEWNGMEWNGMEWNEIRRNRRGRHVSIVAYATFLCAVGSLTASPPVNPSKLLPPTVVVYEPGEPWCGWRRLFETHNAILTPPWHGGDWNPLCEGSAAITGNFGAYALSCDVETACVNVSTVLDLCACEDLTSPWMRAKGWQKKTVVPLESSPDESVWFRVRASATIMLSGRIDVASWCAPDTGNARVCAIGKLIVSSNLHQFEYERESSTDVVFAAGSTAVSASLDGGIDGIVPNIGFELNTNWVVGGTTALLVAAPILFDEWAEYCGNPTGRWVKMDGQVLGFAQCLDGADATYDVEIGENQLEIELVSCECLSNGAAVPEYLDGSGGGGLNP